MSSLTRREFLQSTSVLAATWLTRPVFALESTTKLRLGGPVFLKTDEPVALAREHRRLGYSAAYAPGVKLSEPERIEAIRRAYAEADVLLAEVGAWVNMLEQNPEKRQKNLDYVTERLALADELGALVCVNIAGSYNPTQWDGPDPRNLSRDYFEATVENCRKVIDAVKPKRARFALEMMGWSLPDGPDSYLKFVKAIDRKEFGVHVDIANIINTPQRFYNNADLINETFRKLGRWIVSVHAKDVVGKDVHFAETMPGRGGLDYVTYLRNVVALNRPVPVLLEHLRTPEEYDEARAYVMRKAAEAQISLA